MKTTCKIFCVNAACGGIRYVCDKALVYDVYDSCEEDDSDGKDGDNDDGDCGNYDHSNDNYA